MTDRDQQLDKLLRSLPRAHADAYFTTRVLGLVNAPQRRSVSFSKLVWAGGTIVAVIAIVVPLAYNVQTESRRDALQQELASIQREHQAIARQVTALGSTAPRPPVYYVGSDARTDYVVDLLKLQSEKARAVRANPGSKEKFQQTQGHPEWSQRFRPVVYQGGPI
ncbi:MAG: hypothetical protein QNJ97_09825 [Myxococcota bacterium]|nr:hypothetical protein [Myxococcota bacterium]